MGNIVGGLIGGAASLFGGKSAKSNALAGFNYLSGKNGVQSFVDTGRNANTQQADLLGINGAAGASRAGPAFQNYLNSTGYGFQRNEGTRAITNSTAARGILNSGSTAKALTKYGQGLADTTFGNYLDRTGTVAGRGLQAAGQIGAAGTEGGRTAADAQQSGITKAGGILGGLASSFLPF